VEQLEKWLKAKTNPENKENAVIDTFFMLTEVTVIFSFKLCIFHHYINISGRC
jgi:hypothetical protein